MRTAAERTERSNRDSAEQTRGIKIGRKTVDPGRTPKAGANPERGFASRSGAAGADTRGRDNRSSAAARVQKGKGATGSPRGGKRPKK